MHLLPELSSVQSSELEGLQKWTRDARANLRNFLGLVSSKKQKKTKKSVYGQIAYVFSFPTQVISLKSDLKLKSYVSANLNVQMSDSNE